MQLIKRTSAGDGRCHLVCARWSWLQGSFPTRTARQTLRFWPKCCRKTPLCCLSAWDSPSTSSPSSKIGELHTNTPTHKINTPIHRNLLFGPPHSLTKDHRKRPKYHQLLVSFEWATFWTELMCEKDWIYTSWFKWQNSEIFLFVCSFSSRKFGICLITPSIEKTWIGFAYRLSG